MNRLFHTLSYDHVMSSSKIEMEEKDIEFVAKLPKIELHLHLDGSLSPGKFQHEDAIKYKSWFLGKVWLYVIHIVKQ